MSFSSNLIACSLATWILIVAWIGSSLSSLKFVLRAQPSEVVLSVMEREQSPGFNLPAKMSIQTVMMDAICSSKLFVALPWSL